MRSPTTVFGVLAGRVFHPTNRLDARPRLPDCPPHRCEVSVPDRIELLVGIAGGERQHARRVTLPRVREANHLQGFCGLEPAADGAVGLLATHRGVLARGEVVERQPTAGVRASRRREPGSVEDLPVCGYVGRFMPGCFGLVRYVVKAVSARRRPCRFGPGSLWDLEGLKIHAPRTYAAFARGNASSFRLAVVVPKEEPPCGAAVASRTPAGDQTHARRVAVPCRAGPSALWRATEARRGDRSLARPSAAIEPGAVRPRPLPRFTAVLQ